MYSKKIIAERLAESQKQLERLRKSERFSLQPYPVPTVRRFVTHLESLLDEEGNLSKTLRPNGLFPDEQQFVLNERLVCRSYFLYWATRYAWIPDVKDPARLILFHPNKAQNIVIDLWGDLEELGLAIAMIQLKARQLGVSTCTELALAQRVQFLENRNALVASSDPIKSRKMAKMMERAWDMQPFYLKSPMQPYESGELLRKFLDTNSSVTVQHGNRLSGIARGDTPTDAHISEIPDFSNAGEHIDASLMNAMHENPNMFLVLESTAKGSEEGSSAAWWKNTWEIAKEGWSKGESDLCPVFLPYFVGDDLYPTKTWLKKMLTKGKFTLDTWKPDSKTIAHAKQCEDYVRNTDYLKRIYGDNWKLPVEMQFWWENKYKQAQRKSKLSSFLEEMPSNDYEAFQYSGRAIIPAELIHELDQNKKPLATYQGKPAVFAIVGDGIPSELEPEIKYVDQSRTHLTIKANWSFDDSVKPLIYRLIPLHHDPALWENRLFIWEFPLPKQYEYCNGIDCSEGIGKDRSVMSMTRKGSYNQSAIQVAEFASSMIPAISLFPHAMALGTFYSNQSDDDFNQCRQAIEINFGGNDLQLELRKYGWANFHQWEGYYDSKSQKTFNKLGWVTNYVTRGLLISRTVKAIKDGYWRINSPHLINELKTLRKEDDASRIEAASGEHDDRFFAGAIGFFSLHVKELYFSDVGGWGEQGEGQKFEITFNKVIEQVEQPPRPDRYIATPVFDNLSPGGSDYDALQEFGKEQTDVYKFYRPR